MRMFFASVLFLLSSLVAAAEPGAQCGGIAGIACGDGEFCRFEINQACGAADQMGTCAKRPDFCTMIYKPVCGCNGKTYSNECQAHVHGVSAAYEGQCRDADEKSAQ